MPRKSGRDRLRAKRQMKKSLLLSFWAELPMPYTGLKTSNSIVQLQLRHVSHIGWLTGRYKFITSVPDSHQPKTRSGSALGACPVRVFTPSKPGSNGVHVSLLVSACRPAAICQKRDGKGIHAPMADRMLTPPETGLRRTGWTCNTSWNLYQIDAIRRTRMVSVPSVFMMVKVCCQENRLRCTVTSTFTTSSSWRVGCSSGLSSTCSSGAS